MADLLRQEAISGQTLTRLEGEQAAMPLSWQPQFSSIRDLSESELSSRVDELIDKSIDRGQVPIPLPGDVVVRLAGALLLGCTAFLAGGCVTWFVPTEGKAVIYIVLILGMVARLLLELVSPSANTRYNESGYYSNRYDSLIELIIERRNYPRRLFAFAIMCFFVGGLVGLALQNR